MQLGVYQTLHLISTVPGTFRRAQKEKKREIKKGLGCPEALQVQKPDLAISMLEGVAKLRFVGFSGGEVVRDRLKIIFKLGMDESLKNFRDNNSVFSRGVDKLG
ncbi:hypothetical protein AVEN_191853-1 [Araneus ventricosus]|uniref:Uncharacterized protein n=1 Tax=Araneus ventricosus TaxID=182803 RepID=A0A4Y2F3Q8_ARAVE|nr:hypothetical protein AVEN_191853-1 [Araneus ventricosus]